MPGSGKKHNLQIQITKDGPYLVTGGIPLHETDPRLR